VKQSGDERGGMQIPHYGIIGIMAIDKDHIFLVIITGRKHAAKFV
jgi:hypothetical protein